MRGESLDARIFAEVEEHPDRPGLQAAESEPLLGCRGVSDDVNGTLGHGTSPELEQDVLGPTA